MASSASARRDANPQRQQGSSRRLDTIRGLLRTFNDARETLFSSLSHAGDVDDAIPWMSKVWETGTYAPLELALKRMYALGKQQAVEGIPLGTLWWHLAQRYLMSETKVVYRVGGRDVESMVHKPRCTCGLRFYSVDQARVHIMARHSPQPMRIVLYPGDYAKLLDPQHGSPKRCERCEGLGVNWLAGEFDRVGVEPFLPPAFLAERRAV